MTSAGFRHSRALVRNSPNEYKVIQPCECGSPKPSLIVYFSPAAVGRGYSTHNRPLHSPRTTETEGYC